MQKLHPTKAQSSILDISFSLPAAQRQVFRKSLDAWKEGGRIKSLWAEDPSLWKGDVQDHMLGWLKAPQEEHKKLLSEGLEELAKKSGEWKNVVLLGMGGSALGAEALKAFLKQKSGGPKLYILDSLIPADVEAVAKKIDLPHTLFIVSSKSGSTLESNNLFQFFWGQLKDIPKEKRGSHFVAVTDPGTSLEKLAKEHGFSHVFHGHPRIGGRYSLFSAFGLVPLTAAGYDLTPLLKGGQEMMKACGPETEAEKNPGLLLGLVIGGACNQGHDKLIFSASQKLKAFGPWLEQLLAESTGKEGTGIFPVLPEGENALKGADRLVVYAGDEKETGEAADTPSVFLDPENIDQIGQMFYLWEFAVAVAGSEMKINPFDQPNVESSKVLSRSLAKTYHETGKLPEIDVFEKEDVLSLSSPHAEKFKDKKGVVNVLKTSFKELKQGDYLAVLLWTGRETDAQGKELAETLQNSLEVPVMLEMGPRFLHSTGQAYKGGKNTGLFLQIAGRQEDYKSAELKELAVLSATQEQGDYKALCEGKRRVLRIEIQGDPLHGLNILEKDIKEAFHQL